MKVAIVHEWLTTLGGSELVLRELLRVFPDAHVFTLIDRMAPEHRQFIGVGEVTVSFLNSIPGVARHYRRMLPLFPAAVRSLDVGGYDIVISNSHAVAKGIRTRPGQLHVCYCLSPMRYAWDLREQYLHESGLSQGWRGWLARGLLEGLRHWDERNTRDVDVFLTLSQYIADRIRRAYGREAVVVYPPVDTGFFTPAEGEASPGRYYFTASRFVPYKRIDAIARAFSFLPGQELVIAGDGPDAAKIRAAAGPNVTFAGHVSRERLRVFLRGARAFIFAAEEDFGIAPVEAQACGVPVIAFGRGGALETVTTETGIFFDEQSSESIAAAIQSFERRANGFDSAACRSNAERFSEARFRREIREFVEREWMTFSGRGSSAPS